ncbi:MAG: type II toxin-antitoxin system HicB family antitoxin [Clostridia bacterium]|nr:type II toxin-antitoxin system HicB family antitoxin [Clostridia bacterium]
MKQFLFPAVFVEAESQFGVFFPDLNITTEGDTIEEAYLFAKDYLRVYCSYVLKFDVELDRPSKYEDIKQKYNNDTVMLIDVILDPKKL